MFTNPSLIQDLIIRIFIPRKCISKTKRWSVCLWAPRLHIFRCIAQWTAPPPPGNSWAWLDIVSRWKIHIAPPLLHLPLHSYGVAASSSSRRPREKPYEWSTHHTMGLAWSLHNQYRILFSLLSTFYSHFYLRSTHKRNTKVQVKKRIGNRSIANRDGSPMLNIISLSEIIIRCDNRVLIKKLPTADLCCSCSIRHRREWSKNLILIQCGLLRRVRSCGTLKPLAPCWRSWLSKTAANPKPPSPQTTAPAAKFSFHNRKPRRAMTTPQQHRHNARSHG